MVGILVVLFAGGTPLLVALGIVLAVCIGVGVVAHRRSTAVPLTPSQTEALRGVFSKALAEGEQVRRDLMREPYNEPLVNGWDRRTLRRIDRAVGGTEYGTLRHNQVNGSKYDSCQHPELSGGGNRNVGFDCHAYSTGSIIRSRVGRTRSAF